MDRLTHSPTWIVMSQSFASRWFLIALASVMLFAAGCREKPGVKVEGKLVKGGKAYSLPAQESLSLSFTGKTIYPANVNIADGTFTVDGPTGKGIPPGKYTISINRATSGTDPASLAKSAELSREFTSINGKEVEITAGTSPKLTIDIGAGTITQ